MINIDSIGQPSSYDPLSENASVLSWLNLVLDTEAYAYRCCCILLKSSKEFTTVQMSSAYAITLILHPSSFSLYLKPIMNSSRMIVNSIGSNAKLNNIGDRGSPCLRPLCWLTTGERNPFTLICTKLLKNKLRMHLRNQDEIQKLQVLELSIRDSFDHRLFLGNLSCVYLFLRKKIHQIRNLIYTI